MNLPSTGYLIVAICCFSRRSRTSFGRSFLLRPASEQTCCRSVWFRRSSLAMPRSLNELLTTCNVSSRDGAEAVVAQLASTAMAPSHRTVFIIVVSSALDRGRIHLCPVGVDAKERDQVDRALRHEDRLGPPLLPEAVVQTPLHRAQCALRDAVRGPGRESACGVLLVQRDVREVLQPD